jgi:hypothetical protein
MPRVQRLTLKQVQMLTPEQINKMTQSEVARALTTVQDVLVKRQKRASAAGIELPGLQNYTSTSTRGLNKGELTKQLKFAVQASQNKTSSIKGVQQVQKETWERIKKQNDTTTQEEPDEEYEEPENPFDDPEFRNDFWDTYDKIKDNTQGFGANGSWKSDTLQTYIYNQKKKGKSNLSIVRSGRKIAREMYEEEQRRQAEIEKEMEPEGYYGNNTDFEIDGDEDLFDL